MNPIDWESRAIRIAAALDTATDELAELIEEIRRRREEEPRKELDRAGPES